jgi:hypothetical protein
MLKQFRVPLYFLFVGSLLGVFLRWQFVVPTSGVNYTFFLHAHSHIMFLGWVFNALYIVFVSHYIPNTNQDFFIRLYVLLQLLTAGMLISFPLEGYGFFSILISTFHTIGALIFIIRFWIKTKPLRTTSVFYARISLALFSLSAAGPFSLGYLMANNMGESNFYNFSIYFYLHFQYNGFFFFGILSLFFLMLEKNQIVFKTSKAKNIGIIFLIACLPSYLLSTLWARPGYGIHYIGGFFAVVQLYAFNGLLNFARKNSDVIRRAFSTTTFLLLSFALAVFGLKFILQLISAFPFAAQMAYEHRPVVIAYLHLVLVGGITAFLFGWYVEQHVLPKGLAKAATVMFMTSFVGMEAILVATPWWNAVEPVLILRSSQYCLWFAGLLSVSYLIFLIASLSGKADKNHLSG